jgi:short-subunit dehydrogenase
VTGASTGIGAAIARHLAGRGFHVFGSVRRAEDEAALERALAGAPLGGLVNNAGIPSDSLRRELLAFGVRVIVIEPGSFKTAIWNKVEAMDLRRWLDWLIYRFLWRFPWRAVHLPPS